MATGKDIRAGRAFVELFTKNDGLEKGLRMASARLMSWGQGLVKIGGTVAAAGAGILAPLLGAVKVAVDMGDELQNAADQTGDTVENLGALAAVAAESGLALDDLLTALFRFQKDGGKGVEEFAAKIDSLADAPDAAAQAFDMFGKAGAKMLRLARGTEGGLSGMIAELKAAGVLMSGDDAKAADKFGDSLGRLELMGKLAIAQIGSALIPTLQRAIGPLTQNAIAAIQWAKANGELIVMIAAVGAGIVAIGGVIAGLGVAFIGAAIAVSSLATIVGFILSPLGLAATAAIALAAALAFLWVTAGSGGSVLSQMAADVSAAFGGVADAIMAGNLQLAMKIVGMQLRIEWLRIMDSLKQAWADVVNFFADGFDSAGALIATTMVHIATVIMKSMLTLQVDVMRVFEEIKLFAKATGIILDSVMKAARHPMQHSVIAKEQEDRLTQAGLEEMNAKTRIDKLEKDKRADLDRRELDFDTKINRKLQAAQQERAGGVPANPEIARLGQQIKDMISKAEGERGAILLKEMIDDIQRPLKELGKQAQDMANIATEARGQFSSSAIQQSLGIGGLADRQVKELQKLNKTNEDIAGILKNMKGLAFD